LLLLVALVPSALGLFVLPAVEFPANGERLSASQLDLLRFALRTDGVLALTGVPGFREARLDALNTLAECHKRGVVRDTLSLILPDGTKRTTLAMDTHGALGEDFGCRGLGAKLQRLQGLVSLATAVFAAALDDAIVVEEEKPLFAAMNNPRFVSYPNFSSTIAAGEHLDHFHVYEKIESSPASDQNQALETHTDQGLFIAIVPSLSMKNGRSVQVADGFEIELKATGKLTKVVIPDDGAAVVFMLGDGITNWINKKAIRPVRPCPHRLVMEEKGITRLWFGRMFFPPKDAFIPTIETTFDKLRMTSVNQGAKNVDFVGCSSRRHILRDLTEAGACGANEIYCWMGCRSTAGLHCSADQSIQCVNQNTGQIWTDETQHCFECAASCYSNSSSAGSNNLANGTSSSGDFCNTRIYPTNMYMDGFNGLASDIPCLIFLFQTWVMDTPVKYAFGSIGAFLIGLTVELLILLRRETKLPLQSRSSSRILRALPDSRRPRLQVCVLMTMYSIQLVLAYFAMLLAMSFAAVIFAMVMLGMICGHYAFNFHTPAQGNEACCNMNAEQQCGPSAKGLINNNGELHSAASSSNADEVGYATRASCCANNNNMTTNSFENQDAVVPRSCCGGSVPVAAREDGDVQKTVLV